MKTSVRYGMFETNSSSTHTVSMATKEQYVKKITKHIEALVKEELLDKRDYFKDWDYQEGDLFILEGKNIRCEVDRDDHYGADIIMHEETLIQTAFTVLLNKICQNGFDFSRFMCYSIPLLNGRLPQYIWFRDTLAEWLNKNHPGFSGVVLDGRFDRMCVSRYSDDIPDFGYTEPHIEQTPIYKYFFGSAKLWNDEDGFKKRLTEAFNGMKDVVFISEAIPESWYRTIDINKS